MPWKRATNCAIAPQPGKLFLATRRELTGSGGLRRTGSEADEHLAGVGAVEQAEEGRGGVVDAVDDGLFCSEGACGEPACGALGVLGGEVLVVADEEAAEGQALADEQ